MRTIVLSIGVAALLLAQQSAFGQYGPEWPREVGPRPAIKLTSQQTDHYTIGGGRGEPTEMSSAPTEILLVKSQGSAPLPPGSPSVAYPTEGMPFDANESCSRGHTLGAFAEFLFVHPRGADVNFAQPKDGCTETAVPMGPLGSVNPHFEPSVRLGFFYFVDDCSWVQASSTWFESHASDRITAAPNTVIDSLITHPNTMDCSTDSLAASASSRIDYRYLDIDYQHLLCSGCNYSVNWLAGLRYGHLKEDFLADFSILGDTTVDTGINFDGGGPRLGLEGDCRVCGRFAVYGRGTASLLAGRFNAHYTQQNIFGGLQATTSYRDDRIVPITELELGLGWTSKSGRISVSLGYNVTTWFNTVTTPNFINAVQSGNFTTNGNNLRDSLSFDGVVNRIVFRF